MILHKLTASPFSNQAMQHCLLRVHSNDAVLLTQDAVYALMDTSLSVQLKQLPNLYVLKDDAEARGVTLHDENVNLISYSDFVELSLKYDNVLSW